MGFISTTSGVIAGAASNFYSLALGSPAVGSNTSIHAAVTDTGSQQVVTTGFTNPDVPRNITATAGGTAADVKAIQVVVTGTDARGRIITETLPAFTVNATGTVTGSKAFATVTSVTIPAHDGTGATTSIGVGSKLGLGVALGRNTVRHVYLNGVKESSTPTVAVSATAVEANTIQLVSALNSSPVIVEITDR